MKSMQFLMGLDDSYMQLRSNILAREPLPDAKGAYVLISSDESHKAVVTGLGLEPCRSLSPLCLTPLSITGNKMTTLAEHIIVAGAENHPPILEKSMYDSWASRIRLFIKGKKHAQKLQDDCDVQATNIILHGLPPNVLYNLFDKFAYVQGETLYEYYWRFSQLINDMHTIGMIMQQVQVNTKFLNALHRNGASLSLIYSDPLALVANSLTLYNPSQSPQHSEEDLIECINKAMAFLSAVASRFPPSNNQLITSSNPRNQSTIQDGRVTVQQVQGRQTQSYAGEGHMARQCTQPKRPRNAAWFKEKLMLVEALEACQILDEEQLAFLADSGISEALVAQQTIP
ncbi:hypothetical protein Tco_1042746 [Tanacetum coccineum]|uniref:Uncharacterized protein n=1 Tax=Tanacetum coccineum TaxID=301880 RepID=A0ABQ5GK02_9ASTR